MSALETQAKKLANHITKGNEAFDPSMIPVFVDLIMQLIDQIRACKTPSEVQEVAKNPGLFQKILVRNAVRKNLGTKGFRAHGDEVIAALYKMGANASVKEIEDLYEEV